MNDLAESQNVDPEVAKVLKLGEKPKRGRRRLLYAFGGLVVVLILLRLLIHPQAVAYELGQAKMGDLAVKVTATGTLQPLNEVEVGAEVSGRIDTVDVDYNDSVKEGEVLAQINTDQLKAQLEQAQAGLAQAQARLADSNSAKDDAQLTYNRTLPLAKKGAESQASLDSARIALERAQATVKDSEAQVELAQAQLDADQSALDKATIRAPTDGIVLDRLVEPGQTVVSTFQTPVLFKLAQDLTRMKLEVDVDEADIGEVKAGQRATFTVDAYPGRPFKATITSVHNAPQTDQGVVTYPVDLSVDNQDLALRPGMTATADILVADLHNVLTVPSGALRFVPEGEAETPPTPLPDGTGDVTAKLWLPQGSAKPRAVDVVAGASDDERTQIVKGNIKAGDKVIIDTVRPKRRQAGANSGT